jgi:ferric-dicitrate binding protein FerR (iron transport regulator)
MNYPIEEYMIRFVARKETQEDVQKLKEWLATDPANRDELKQWLVVWDTVGMMNIAEKFNPDKAYQRFVCNNVLA